MKDTAHYAPLLSDSDYGDPVVAPRRYEKRTSIFYLAIAIIVAQALLILGFVAFNWSGYTKCAACSQAVYCKSIIFADCSN